MPAPYRIQTNPDSIGDDCIAQTSWICHWSSTGSDHKAGSRGASRNRTSPAQGRVTDDVELGPQGTVLRHDDL